MIHPSFLVYMVSSTDGVKIMHFENFLPRHQVVAKLIIIQRRTKETFHSMT